MNGHNGSGIFALRLTRLTLSSLSRNGGWHLGQHHDQIAGPAPKLSIYQKLRRWSLSKTPFKGLLKNLYYEGVRHVEHVEKHHFCQWSIFYVFNSIPQSSGHVTQYPDWAWRHNLFLAPHSCMVQDETSYFCVVNALLGSLIILELSIRTSNVKIKNWWSFPNISKRYKNVSIFHWELGCCLILHNVITCLDDELFKALENSENRNSSPQKFKVFHILSGRKLCQRYSTHWYFDLSWKLWSVRFTFDI